MTFNNTQLQGRNLAPCYFHALILGLTLCLTSYVSPAYAAIATSTIPYGITYPSGTLNQGDTAILSVWAGNSGQSIDEAVGFDLSFELTSDASFPTSLTADLASSWIANGYDMTVTVTLEADIKTITIHAVRVSGHENGYGEIVSFPVVSATDGITASDMLLNDGGGVIITVDDVMIRQASPMAKSSQVTVFPNPTRDKISFLSADEGPISCQIIDQQGRLVFNGKISSFSFVKAGLSPGVYLLWITQGEAWQGRKIVFY